MERAGDQPRLSGLARLTRPLLLSRTLCCHLLPVSRHVAADWAIFDQLTSLRLQNYLRQRNFLRLRLGQLRVISAWSGQWRAAPPGA